MSEAENGDVSWSAPDSDPPNHRCGFELLPGDVEADKEYDGLDEWRNDARTTSCCRGAEMEGRCQWHTDAEPEVLQKAVAEREESETNLDGAILRDVQLNDGVSFAGCRLRGATVENVTARFSDFTEADLSGVEVCEAELSGAEFIKSNLWRAEFSNSELSGTKFSRAHLIGSEFHEADLPGAKFSHADLREVEFSKTNISWAEFPDANLSMAKFSDADLSRAKLPKVRLRKADLIKTDLYKTEFHNADLYKAEFHNANLRRAEFPDADLRYTDISNKDLRGTKFSRSDLRVATVSNVEINRATRVDTLLEPSAPSPWDKIRRFTTSTSKAAKEAEDELPDAEPTADPTEWDRVARAYHGLKHEFNENGFVGRARKFHIKERRARRYETACEEGWFSRSHVSKFVSGLFTGYGVGVRRLAGTMLFLFAFSTAVYAVAGVPSNATALNPLVYSVITFTTAPPGGISGFPWWAKVVAGLETFAGTLLIVSLGFVLGNREQF